MLAGRLVEIGSPPVVLDVPVPVAGPDEALVAVRACGICGSDVHVVHGITPSGPLPLTLGHEAAGVTDDGRRVAVAAGWGCGHCPACLAGAENRCPAVVIPGIHRDGAQAEYVVVPERALVPLPDSVDFATGAILTDAVATPWHAIKRAGVTAGQTVAVYGLGGLGLHAVTLLAAVVGASVVGVDRYPGALERARRFGAADVVDASGGKPARAVRELTGGGVDHAFEFVGSAAAVDQAVKSLRPGGTCTVVGITPEPLGLLPQALFVAAELRVQGSFGCDRTDLEELVALVAGGTLDLTGTITHRYALADFPEAYRVLESKEGDPIRVVVDQIVTDGQTTDQRT